MESKTAGVDRNLKNHSISFWITFLVCLTISTKLLAGVMVAPTSVIMSDTRRTGRITIQNPTNQPKEVSISLSYGIPLSDSLGNVHIELQDSAVTDPKSCMDWIKAFPRKMILPPNSRQVVRLVAKPPKDLPDGEYWSRIVVRAQEGQTTIPVANGDDKISTKLNMIMQTVLVCKYRTGNLLSRLNVVNTEVIKTDTAVIATIDMENKGNVSYVGLLDVKLKDADDKEIASRQIDLAVYSVLSRRVVLPVNDHDYKEPLRVEVDINNEGRADIDPEDMIIGNNIEYSLVVP